MADNKAAQAFDVLVIGSGFGGSTTALRLSEKGYSVGVLEAGQRWNPDRIPPTNWRLRRWLWAPALRMFGPQRLTVMRNSFIVSASAVGGGSTVYACTLYKPLDGFYADPQWAHITDWKSELAPYYDQAERMLGSAVNPRLTPSDDILREVAEDMGVADTFHPTTVGVFFGTPGETVPDPYFGGVGPDRTGCVFCSECMIGCRHNAKNTLLTNYLYLAEQTGAVVHAMTTVTAVRPLDAGGYEVTTQRTGTRGRRHRQTFTANDVVFSAASLGTQRLLHDFKRRGLLPHLSPTLGHLARTNNEAILSIDTRGRDDFSQGVTISSSIHPTADTHVEAIHYGKGSNVMHMLTTPLIDGSTHRLLRWFGGNLRHPIRFARSLSVRRASERGFQVVVMKDTDSSLTTYLKRGLTGWKMTTKQGAGEPNPNWIPIGHDVVRRAAEKVGGDPRGMLGDVVNRPTTAHFIGGCAIGTSPETGVVDPYQRVFGHPGLHIVDGSTISANLGVNPSLTITAQAERALAFWPNKGEADTRPALGEEYERIAPVSPLMPVVPSAAPGALRLPLEPISR